MTKMSTSDETSEEETYRNELFCGDFTKVFYSTISCTVCEEVLNSDILEGNIFEHGTLKVLLCENHYRVHTAQQTVDSRINGCIWCGHLSEFYDGIVCCQCDRIFCKKCVILNFGVQGYEDAKLRSNISVWQCFVCAKKEHFLFLRAICFAAKHCLKGEANEIAEANNLIEESVECVICLEGETSSTHEKRTNYELIELVGCSHSFHSDCFKDWIKVNRSCPICRSINVAVRRI